MVKHSAVNAVLPSWSMMELPNLCFSNTELEYQNVKIDSEIKSEKSKRSNKIHFNDLLAPIFFFYIYCVLWCCYLS